MSTATDRPDGLSIEGLSTEGVKLVLELNWDRLAIPLAILTGLFGGAAIGLRILETAPWILLP